jgi:hypothetical protein
VQTTDASGTALSSDALDAVASADSVWAERVTVAWPGGLHPDVSSMIISAETNATLVGGLPDQTRRPVGFQSRTLKLVLGGMVDGTDEAFDAYALFNPLNKDSDFYRKDLRGTKLTYDVGPYVRGSAEPAWIRQFTGEIDDITPGSDGAVIFDCLDRMNELRSVVAMPAVVTAPPYNAGLTPEFGHDALLRNATNGAVSESPPVRPHCILSIGFRSSIQPEVGTLDVTYPQLPPTFGPGAWGTAYAGNQPATDPSGSYWVGPAYGLDTSTWPLTTKLAFEATVTGVGATGLNASFRYGVPYMLTHFPGQPFLYSVHGLIVDIDDTGVNVTTTAGSDFWTITLDSSPHTLLFWASVSGGTITCHAKVDGGTVHNFAGVTFTDDMSTWTNALLFTAGDATVEAWQTTTETAPATSYPFTPQAVLAPSTLALTVTPAVSGDPLEAFKDISTAELATAGFDEKGIYRTATRASRRGGVAVGTYSSDSTLDDVEIQLTGAGYANRVQAPVTTWKFAAPATVWSSETARVIPGHTAGHSFIVDTGDQLVAAVDGTISLLPDGGGNDGHSYFRASVDAAGLNRHTGLTNGRIAQIDSTHFRVTFDNTWQRKAYLITPVGYSDLQPGTPTLQIGGIADSTADTILADSQWPPAAEGGAKTTPIRGEVPYVFPDNGWRQDLDSGQALTDDTLCELRRPVLDLSNVTMSRPDPTLQLGDRIHLVAPHLYLDDDVIVFGIHNNGPAAQTLDVRMVAAPGMFVLGVAGRCELGVNTYV